MANFTLKYTLDENVIFKGNVYSYEDFIAANISMSTLMMKNVFFEYGVDNTGNDRFDLIDTEGHHFPQDLNNPQIDLLYDPLISAIKKLR